MPGKRKCKNTSRPVPGDYPRLYLSGLTGKDFNGGLAEWLNAAVLKTVEVARPPGVRIPRPPHFSSGLLMLYCRRHIDRRDTIRAVKRVSHDTGLNRIPFLHRFNR